MRFITLEKEQNNYSKCSAFASSAAFSHLFFSSNSTVLENNLKEFLKVLEFNFSIPVTTLCNGQTVGLLPKCNALQCL